MRQHVLGALCALGGATTGLHAQAPVASVRGVVYDSLSGKPLAGAMIEIAGLPRTAIADRRGAFQLDSVPLGARRFTFSAPALDSIGLYGFARDIDVRVDDAVVTLATPSFRTFYARLCSPADKPTTDSAIVFGTVYDAMTRARVREAGINLTWFAVDTVRGRIMLMEPLRSARADADGNYGLCGLPSDLALTTTAGTPYAASGTVTLTVGTARVLRRDLFISDEMGRDSTAMRSGAATGSATGSGELRGVVHDERGQRMAGALLMLSASGRSARTDSTGRYLFRNVPLGTQEISVRQLGRGALFRTVDIVAGEMPDEIFVMPEATTLVAVDVRGAGIPGRDQAEFLKRRKQGLGYYLDEREIATRADIGAALRRLPGLDVRYGPAGLTMRSTRGYGCGQPTIVIDGHSNSTWGVTTGIALSDTDLGVQPTPRLILETLTPADVKGVEYYPSGSRCGTLMVWTRFARW